MRDINDKKLDSLLTEYYGAEPSETFTYCPREKKLAPIPFWHSSRRIAAAASLVLVSVLGIALFFLFGNKSDHSPLAVRPSPTVISAPSEDGGEDDGAPHDGTVTPASETVHSDPSQSASESSAIFSLTDVTYSAYISETTSISSPNCSRAASGCSS